MTTGIVTVIDGLNELMTQEAYDQTYVEFSKLLVSGQIELECFSKLSEAFDLMEQAYELIVQSQTESVSVDQD